MQIKINFLTVVMAVFISMTVVAGMLALGVELLDSASSLLEITSLLEIIGLILVLGGFLAILIIVCAALAVINILADIECAQEEEQ
jgi:hypothetical protein